MKQLTPEAIARMQTKKRQREITEPDWKLRRLAYLRAHGHFDDIEREGLTHAQGGPASRPAANRRAQMSQEFLAGFRATDQQGQPRHDDPPCHAIVLEIPTTEMLDYFAGRKKLRLPEGATLTAFWRADSRYSQEATDLCLRIEHPTLPAIAPGARIPHRRPKKVT